jgi:hypothetical protein
MKAGRLTTLGQCLQYLKTCAWTELQNHFRKQAAINARQVAWIDEDDLDNDAPPENLNVLSQLNRMVTERSADDDHERERRAILDQLAELLRQTVQNELERLVTVETWELGLAPREIYARHPDRFADVNAIHLVVRNVLRRLQRHPQIKRLLE